MCAIYYEWPDLFCFKLPGIASYYFAPESARVEGLPEADVSERLVRESFNKSVLPFFIQESGYCVLHASSNITPDGKAIAFCGTSHSGKSTLSYALAQIGFCHWSDDFFVIQCENKHILTKRTESRPQLRLASKRFFEQTGYIAEPADSLRIATPSSAEILALFFLDTSSQKPPGYPGAIRISPEDTFKKLMENSFWLSFIDRERKTRMIDQHVEIANQVTAYTLSYQRTWKYLNSTIEVIRSVVERN